MTITDRVDILLVEDNPRDAELALRALKSRNLANKLLWVKDGAEALEFIFGRGTNGKRKVCGRTKVILLDLKLPKVDGLEVLEQLKAIGVTLLLAVVGTTIIAFIVKAVVGLRPSEEVEVSGLDLAEHGEEGYHTAS